MTPVENLRNGKIQFFQCKFFEGGTTTKYIPGYDLDQITKFLPIFQVFFHLLITQKLMYGPRALWPMKFLVLKTHFIMVWTVEPTGITFLFIYLRATY